MKIHIGSFIFTSGVLTYSTVPHKKRFNQFSLKLPTGELLIKEKSPFSVTYNSLLIKSVTKVEAESFRKYVEEVLFFDENPFTLKVTENTKGEFDIGTGYAKNHIIENCTYNAKSTEGLFLFKVPLLYDITIPFFFTEV